MAAKAAESFQTTLFEDNFGPNLTHKIDFIKDQVEVTSNTFPP
jgi:hypothetical protein